MPAYESSLNARTVTYQWVRDGVIQRMGRGARSAVTADQMADLAEFITTAYGRCLEKMTWPEREVNTSLTISNSLVTYAQVQGSDLADVMFWTADPDVLCSHACQIPLLRYDSTGYLLDTTLTTIHATFTPRAPVFDSTPVNTGASYAVTSVVFDAASGNCYEAIATNAAGNALTDTTQWRPLTILWSLRDVVKLLALADTLGNTDQERAQAADLIQQAEDRLNQIAGRELRAAANRMDPRNNRPVYYYY